MTISAQIERVIANWRDTVGSKPAKTQSVITRLTHLRGVEPPAGSNVNDAQSYYDLKRRVFEDNGGGSQSLGRIASYKRECCIREAKRGNEATMLDAFVGIGVARRVVNGSVCRVMGAPVKLFAATIHQ